MVKRRIIGICISVIVVAFLGSGVLYYSGYDLQDFIGEEASEEISVLLRPVEDTTKNAINDLTKAYNIILEDGTRDFYAGYQVDQAFLMWLNKRFGDDTIMDLAYRIYEGYGHRDLWYHETGNSIHVLWLMYCEEKQYESYNLKNVYWMENTDDHTVTIDFTGDINLADEWYTMQKAITCANGVYDCLSVDVIKELQSADISVINNEYVLTDGGDRQIDKAYTFGAKTANVSMLQAFGADLANLANNHAYDYREEGLRDTIQTLESSGIASIGAGANLEDARAVKYFVVNGRKIAFVAATEIERYTNYTKPATKTEAGVFKTKDISLVEETIREAEETSDYVVMNIHWGNEGSLRYTDAQCRMAERFILAGADAVIGGHPHRLQGIEYIHDVPVAFSLGNFWFSTGTLYTTIAQIHIDKDGNLSLRMIPCMQKDLMVTKLSSGETENFYKYVADISKDIAIDKNGYIYNSENMKPEEKDNTHLWYSGMSYGTYSESRDLEDRKIDIVGNLQ